MTHGEKDLKISIDRLNQNMERSVSLKENFFKGLIYGLGFFIGGTLLVALVAYVLSQYNTAPIVGDYISKILKIIEQK